MAESLDYLSKLLSFEEKPITNKLIRKIIDEKNIIEIGGNTKKSKREIEEKI